MLHVTFETYIICNNESRELLPRNIAALVLDTFWNSSEVTWPLLNQSHKILQEVKVYLIKCVSTKLGCVRTMYWEHTIHNEKRNESGGKLESQKEYGAKLSILGKKRNTLYF